MLCSGEYATMIRSKDHSFDLRKAMVRVAKARGIRAAAREFAVSRNTVRTWLRRFEAEHWGGLKSRSTRPKSSPNKLRRSAERRVLEARRLSGFGAARLVEEFELPCGISATRRILREHALTRKPRKKHHKKNDLREIKKRLAPFQRLQIDVKALRDQPRYLPQAHLLGLPLSQFSVRDVRSGGMWLTYATETAAVYAHLTVRRLLRHLQACGVDLSQTLLQSDNGSEFKGNQLRLDGTLLADTVAVFGAQHRFNPPSCPNANADVESLHARIEPEFYDREDFSSLPDFLSKASLYQTYWNLGRPNRSKGRQTPWEILHALLPDVSVQSLLLPPTGSRSGRPSL
ncbi:helix-turn-helix domain-containing protein, partial [Planctomycetota bacterium]